MSRRIIDTNILVYAHDRSEPEKQRRAKEILERLADQKETFLTAQVLAETFRVITQKIAAPIGQKEAEQQIDRVRKIWKVLPITEAVVCEAIRGSIRYHLNYWDCQIWAVARLNHIHAILTEDLPSDTEVESVAYLNPFEPNFNLNQFA